MARGHQLLAGLALLASTLLCQAQSAAGVFQVQITLNSADGSAGVGGTCISDALSSQTGATVRVVCNSEQFVDINPTPGRPFLGTHGGAFRYAFGAGSWGIDPVPARIAARPARRWNDQFNTSPRAIFGQRNAGNAGQFLIA